MDRGLQKKLLLEVSRHYAVAYDEVEDAMVQTGTIDDVVASCEGARQFNVSVYQQANEIAAAKFV